MKKLSINLIGTDDFDLTVTPPTAKEEKKIEIQEESVTSEIPNAGKKKVEVDVDLLEALVAIAKSQGKDKSNDDKLSKAIDKLAEATSESNDTMDRRFLGARPIDSYTIDKDDVMENNGFVIFFAKSASFAIYDDKRMGFTIKPPYNRSFKFKTIQRIVDKSSTRNPVYMSLSAVIIRSKKEAKWLREHTLFGIKFHEKKDGGKEISEDLQDKIVKSWSIVNSLDDHTVMQRCMSEGVSVDTPDIGQLRKRLSLKIAQNMVNDENKIRRKPVQDLEDNLMGNLKTSDEQNFAVPSTTY